MCNFVDNPLKMWYATSCMANLSMENFSETCGTFSAMYIQMKVLRGEAYQSVMLTNASIVPCDMQGGSCSKIILYTKVTEWYDSCSITPWKVHSENNLQ